MDLGIIPKQLSGLRIEPEFTEADVHGAAPQKTWPNLGQFLRLAAARRPYYLRGSSDSSCDRGGGNRGNLGVRWMRPFAYWAEADAEHPDRDRGRQLACG